ncbi:energy transducer TonB [Flavobacterium sp. 3HN19-14]|uniref:energy transducer TonB n=1 Tax=Flavobacterium sp. 3HN19-14 TaxID=3448133 RepID=UPI003EDF3F10
MKTKNIYFLTAIFALISGGIYAQEAPSANKGETADESIYNSVEVRPDFPGGMKKFYEFVANNYETPKGFKGNGMVMLQFIVEKDGTLSGIKVLKDPGAGAGDEAVECLKPVRNGNPAFRTADR